MKTGTSRIVLGIVLMVVLGLLALRGVVVFLLGSAMGSDSAFLLGDVVGVVLVALLLVAVIRGLLLKGLAQRRAFLAAQGERAQPTVQ